MPFHYISILGSNQFYYARKNNKFLSRISTRPGSRFILEMDKVYNSFYMTIILFNSGNTTIKNHTKIRLRRHTAHANIIHEFITIFDEYRNQKLQFLNNVSYL